MQSERVKILELVSLNGERCLHKVETAQRDVEIVW